MLAAVVALALVFFVFTGGGRIAVFTEGHAVDVFLDDVKLATVEPHDALWLDVPHGTHHVRAGKTEWRLEVSRGFEQVLPIGGQCFVAFDVTNLLYTLQGGREEPAVFDNPVAARFFDSEPFDLPERTWLSMGEMPKQMKYAERASLLTQVPCSKRDATDEELSELAPRPLFQ